MILTNNEDFIKDLHHIIDTCKQNENLTEEEREITEDIISQCNDIIASVELDYPPEAIKEQFNTLQMIIKALSEVRGRGRQ